MKLFLFYFAFILSILLSTADPTEFTNQSPTSRRLLLFGGGLTSPVPEKKSRHISSPRKPASPPKFARQSDSHGHTVFIRPQTSVELGHKMRSYTHLLKSKLYTNEERAQLKLLQQEKKQSKKTTTAPPPIATKTQELVAIDDNDLDRCRALLHIDQQSLKSTKAEKKTKKEKKPKQDKLIKPVISSKIKDATSQAAENIKKKVVAAAATALPIESKKIKPTKSDSNIYSNEKKTPPTSEQPSEARPVTEIPIKKTPPPPPQPTLNTKSKREKIILINEPTESFDTNENEIDDKNNSVVDRAYHFVKNMFQLSDEIRNGNNTQEDQIIDITNEQQQHHHSRKLLTIEDNDYDFNLHLNDEQSIETINDLSFHTTSFSKRQLLSFKPNKHVALAKTSNTKGKKPKAITNASTNKPKVGWAYRYRISRYLDAQKMKRTGKKNRATGGGEGKRKQSQQQKQQQQLNAKKSNKKTSLSSNTKVSKRKLLEYDTGNDSTGDGDEISDQDNVNSVSNTEHFVPKRHLLVSKINDEEEDDEDSNKEDERRRMKSFEELTDPAAIVQSYDSGLFKPRVGWQFRYRVSRYIDSLRENIREDQQRLKLGLEAIKRKTPQELSGRRKRVLDKPFAPDADELKKKEEEEAIAKIEETKPNVGWRYRYRISKMLEAKARGDYIDDEEEKRQARLEQKKKPQDSIKSRDDNKSIEGEEGLDPELRKVNEEGRSVGWAYRYRVRRKLDDLKQQEKETGIPFNLETLGGKREKKGHESKSKLSENKTGEAIEQKPEEKKKNVGWKYRYRVSRMLEAQKRDASLATKPKKQVPILPHERLDPELEKLSPEDRIVGWKYRYRIRRKLDSTKNATRETESGKRTKKQSSKNKNQEKIIDKVEESIEKILNIDDIDETPFMEYFRRTSSYILFGLVPAARKSICLLPLPVTFSFCKDKEETDKIVPIIEKSKPSLPKKLRTKKEHRAKQFIRSHSTKLGADDKATERRVDETMKDLFQNPLSPPSQAPSGDSNQKKKQRSHSSRRRHTSEQTKHIDEEEHPIKKVVGVESKTKKNKKQFQIIGKEIKAKHKHSPPHPSSPTVPTPPSNVETPNSTPTPPLRSISEIIQQEAVALLGTKPRSSKEPGEINYEIAEANEVVQERAKPNVSRPPPILIDSATSGEEDGDSTSNDHDIKTKNVHDGSDL